VTEFKLDRMALDDVGVNPRRLAEAIHTQLGETSGAVPVKEIALALDIQEIREERLTNIEAALVTTPERDRGAILVNLNSNRQRRRFSVGHELLHFLNPLHLQTTHEGFWCSRTDMIASALDDSDRHARQEAEANAFSIELLTPRRRLQPYLRAPPDLTVVLRLAGDFDVSREAAARRYVELHSATLAAVFCLDGKFSYARRGKEFPALFLKKGQPVSLAGEGAEGQVSLIEEVDAADWVYKPPRGTLTAQTLYQQDKFSTTLLQLLDSDDHEDLDDAYDRFTRYGRDTER
jgi:Zn-dependent peptidase ImmA (M78 family)